MIKHVVTWTLDKPESFVFEERFSSGIVEKDYGGNLVIPINGSAYKVKGGPRSFYCYQSMPGVIPLYYMIFGGAIYVSQSMLAMRTQAHAMGLPVKAIMACKEGIAYHFSAKGLRRYVVDTITPETKTSLSLKQAGDELFVQLIAAAEFFKGTTVVTPISGGTDGILTALALKEAGVTQKCVCVGRTEDDFDPKFARKYADQLGLDYTFLPLPETDEDLEQLLKDTLPLIEMSDFSNVLMGMCNYGIAQWAKSKGAEYVLTADLADVVVGQDLLTYAKFNRDTEVPTSTKWSQWRMINGMRNLPNNMMVYKIFAQNDLKPAQLFHHRGVIQLLLGLSLEVTPPNGRKPVYYEILDRYIGDGSWRDGGKKVGFYTGSTIGKIRLENPILSDQNIRKVYSTITKDTND
jgi:hypothetical protein